MPISDVLNAYGRWTLNMVKKFSLTIIGKLVYVSSYYNK